MLTVREKYLSTTNATGSLPFASSSVSVKQRFERINNVYTWLIIPLLGVLLPTFTGLLQPMGYPVSWILVQYAFFIGVAEIIYKGNMFFLHSIRLHYEGSSMPYFKIVSIYFMVNIVYSGIISLASLSAWSSFVTGSQPFAKPVITTTLVILICVLFINNLYEIFYLQAAKKASEEKMILLEDAKKQAELQALGSEIDPHFMYNALTSLSYLLQQNPAEADNYNAMLAAQYRYVLKNKCRHLVPLSQELEFCRQYFLIQQLRFGNTVLLQVLGGGQPLEKLQVPPLSVQTLVENALKHNSFSAEKPLVVQVLIKADSLLVSNRIQPQPYAVKGTGTGLDNLNKRVRLLVKQPITVSKENNEFCVKLPLAG